MGKSRGYALRPPAMQFTRRSRRPVPLTRADGPVRGAELMIMMSVRRAVGRWAHVHRVASSDRVGAYRHDRCRCGAHRFTWLERGTVTHTPWAIGYHDALGELRRRTGESH